MRISFNNLKAFLAHVNGRSEVHGEERQPAGDLKFEATVDNKFLEQLHPTLKVALFFHDTSAPGDLVDQANEENPDYLPHLRFPHFEPPLKWSDEMSGGTLTIHHGVGGRSDLVLEDIKLNELKITPKAGAICDIAFRVQGHPDEKQFGRAYTLIQSEVEISIKPPEAAPIS